MFDCVQLVLSSSPFDWDRLDIPQKKRFMIFLQKCRTCDIPWKKGFVIFLQKYGTCDIPWKKGFYDFPSKIQTCDIPSINPCFFKVHNFVTFFLFKIHNMSCSIENTDVVTFPLGNYSDWWYDKNMLLCFFSFFSIRILRERECRLCLCIKLKGNPTNSTSCKSIIIIIHTKDVYFDMADSLMLINFWPIERFTLYNMKIYSIISQNWRHGNIYIKKKQLTLYSMFK